MSTLAPPDVEAALVALLESPLGVPVATRVPSPRPGSFVRVTLTGGVAGTLVTADAQVLVECWAGSSPAAYTLARSAWAELRAAVGTQVTEDVWLVDADPGVPVNFPDPDSSSPRYQFLATVRVALTEVP